MCLKYFVGSSGSFGASDDYHLCYEKPYSYEITVSDTSNSDNNRGSIAAVTDKFNHYMLSKCAEDCENIADNLNCTFRAYEILKT